MRWGCGQRGYTPGKKPQLYPTNLTYSTPVTGWKALGCVAGDGFVECVGLCVCFGGGLTADEQMKNKENDIFHAIRG